MLKEKIRQRLSEINQPHLAKFLDQMSEAEQKELLASLSTDLFQKQQKRLQQPHPLEQTFEPVREANHASEKWRPYGVERLAQSKVACLILAGGQGSRLQSTIPKALIAVTADQKKTLLELHLEKIANASTFHNARIPCAIITSRENHPQIAQFLKQKDFCNLDPQLLTLVTQTEAPFLDDQGNWILRDHGKIASGPDGNGHALHLLKASGILDTWEKQGIEQITIIPIDNALADPVDPILIGYHAAHPSDVTLKVIERPHSEEKVGMVVRKEGRITVQEYSEILPHQNPPTCLAHINLFILNLSFAKRISQVEFPWHLARKQDPISKQWIWKFERFIFDMLPHAEATHLLLYPREAVYAPLKNATGEKSLTTVREALQKLFSS
jgi:UDP-N-acetylglucosamine/UDP-N-acetylgalactosamine diphosphorylase